MKKKFEQLKHEVLQNFSDADLYKTSILKNPKLYDTKLYKFCEAMPKGADLHAHGGALTPVRLLIDFVISKEELLIDTNPSNKGYLKLANKNPGNTYMPLREALNKGLLTKEELFYNWTLIGCPNNMDVWAWFQDLFEKHTDLNEVGPTCKDYFQNSYEYYCSQNIFHIEQRLFLKGSESDASKKAHCVFDAYIDAKKKYPNLTVRAIPVGLKSNVFDMKVTEEIYKNTVSMYNKLKDGDDDFFVGIDLVNEEDTSRSISDFESLINKTLRNTPGLNLALHAGESTSSNNNEIEKALNLGTKRIGHGLNLWAHPELKQAIKKKNICLEVCPVSNQSLGFCDDLRQHPAKNYFREGIPIVLCSDDPTYQENNSLTDDFFMAILAWDLKLNEVARLTSNSIKYSFLNDINKFKQLVNWKNSWSNFLCDF